MPFALTWLWVALQGLGNVGMLLGRNLRRQGMDLTVADLNEGRARQAELELGVRVVCGSANNVLASPEAGDEFVRRGILYAPDYLVNAGGLIRGAEFDLLKRADRRASEKPRSH